MTTTKSFDTLIIATKYLMGFFHFFNNGVLFCCNLLAPNLCVESRRTNERTKQMNEELKPCPFCGEIPTIISTVNDFAYEVGCERMGDAIEHLEQIKDM